MSEVDVVRAWKDADFRAGLSEAELAQLPANPAGLIELSDADLMPAMGMGNEVQPDSITFGPVCISVITCMLKAGERERPPRLPNLKLVTKIGHPFSYHLNSEQAS
jgi:mersacidin/lichenicidin family type 2 lantibiotic